MFEATLAQLRPFSQVFRSHGKQVYLVGGAVRNLLLGKDVQDYDFTTDALPTEVQAFFPRVIPTGIQHGTVTVMFHGQPFEVTTFRTDGTYSDQRRPDSVAFTASLQDDLSRRDFTMNALALDLETGAVIDYHAGQVDLRQRIIRAIGNPLQRFEEDALRILRFFRFAAQLGFDLDPATFKAAASRILTLKKVSRERVREELLKTLAGVGATQIWPFLDQLGILALTFPELSMRSFDENMAAYLNHLQPWERWSFWIGCVSPHSLTTWEASLRSLTLSNQVIKQVLCPLHWLPILANSGSIQHKAKACLYLSGSRQLQVSEKLFSAWIACGILPPEVLTVFIEMERLEKNQEAIFLKDLQIKGQDLLAAGCPAGPKLGQVLQDILHQVWEHPEWNQPDALQRLAIALLKAP